MVNERLINEKMQALQVNSDRYKTLFSVLRGLRNRVVDPDGDREMSPEQRQRDKNLVRTSMNALFAAGKAIGEQLYERRIVRHRFEMMLDLVTRVGGNAHGWWNHGTQAVVDLIAIIGDNYANGLIVAGELNSQL